jgi:hypothetical protein
LVQQQRGLFWPVRWQETAGLAFSSIKKSLLVLSFSFVTGTQGWLKACALPSFGQAKEK